MYQRFEDYNTKLMFAEMHFGYDVLEEPKRYEDMPDCIIFSPVGFELEKDLEKSRQYAEFIERKLQDKLEIWFIIKRKEKKIISNIEKEGYVLQLYYVLEGKNSTQLLNEPNYRKLFNKAIAFIIRISMKYQFNKKDWDVFCELQNLNEDILETDKK